MGSVFDYHSRIWKRQKTIESFDATDMDAVAHMSASELAKWQWENGPDSPHHALATFEWQRRLNERQVRAVKVATWIGLLGGVGGVVIGAILSAYFK